MRLRSVSTLAAAAAIALILLAPGRVAADPLLHSDNATNESTDREPDTVLLSDVAPRTPSPMSDWIQDSSDMNGFETADSNDDEDFLTPVFLPLADGSPLRLYGAQAIVNPLPEPSLTFLLTCGLAAIGLAERAMR
jgi:hypothetical protein